MKGEAGDFNPDRVLSLVELQDRLEFIITEIGQEFTLLRQVEGKGLEQFEADFEEEFKLFEDIKLKILAISGQPGIRYRDLQNLKGSTEQLLKQISEKALKYGYKPSSDSGTKEDVN